MPLRWPRATGGVGEPATAPSTTGIDATGGRTNPALTRPMKRMSTPMSARQRFLMVIGKAASTCERNPAGTRMVMMVPR